MRQARGGVLFRIAAIDQRLSTCSNLCGQWRTAASYSFWRPARWRRGVPAAAGSMATGIGVEAAFLATTCTLRAWAGGVLLRHGAQLPALQSTQQIMWFVGGITAETEQLTSSNDRCAAPCNFCTLATSLDHQLCCGGTVLCSIHASGALPQSRLFCLTTCLDLAEQLVS